MIYKMLPRRLFVAHTKLLLVSERAARDGIRDLVNFIEMQLHNRSSVPMLIADGPLSSIMNTITPLEPVPSDSIDNRINLLLRNSLLISKPIKVNDVIEWMEKSEMIVLPMIAQVSRSASGGSPSSEDTDANQNNFIVKGGAVFRDYRMVGKLNDSELVWYNLLNGGQGHHIQRFQVDEKQVSAGLKLIRLKRNIIWKSGQPVIQFRLDIQLSTALASEYVPHSRDKVKELESRLNEIIAEKSLAFYQMTKSRGWDLLKIRDLLRKHAPNVSDIEQAANNAEVEIHVNTKLLRTSSLSQPY
jgi:spore germination protein KC